MCQTETRLGWQNVGPEQLHLPGILIERSHGPPQQPGTH